MAQLIADRRDVDFVLYEQFDSENACFLKNQTSRYFFDLYLFHLAQRSGHECGHCI